MGNLKGRHPGDASFPPQSHDVDPRVPLEAITPNAFTIAIAQEIAATTGHKDPMWVADKIITRLQQEGWNLVNLVVGFKSDTPFAETRPPDYWRYGTSSRTRTTYQLQFNRELFKVESAIDDSIRGSKHWQHMLYAERRRASLRIGEKLCHLLIPFHMAEVAKALDEEIADDANHS